MSDVIKTLEAELIETRGLLKETAEQLNSLYSYLAWQSDPGTRWESGMMSSARAVLDKLRHTHSDLFENPGPPNCELDEFIKSCKGFGVNEHMARAAWKGFHKNENRPIQ